MAIICPNCGQHLGETEWCPTCLRHNDPNTVCHCPECNPPEPEPAEAPDDASLPDGWDDGDPF